MDIETLNHEAGKYALTVIAALHPEPDQTILLLGPDEPDFWKFFSKSPEYNDGQPDPIDRWSERVLNALASKSSAQAVFPFGGPPYHPFIKWALSSDSVWQSPVQLLVNNASGLFVSFRGALIIDERLELPAPDQYPCETCAEKPCLSACPAAALTSDGYNVSKCHEYLDIAAGTECLTNGCLVRRACPIGQNKRLPSQSAFHMRAFHKG